MTTRRPRPDPSGFTRGRLYLAHSDPPSRSSKSRPKLPRMFIIFKPPDLWAHRAAGALDGLGPRLVRGLVHRAEGALSEGCSNLAHDVVPLPSASAGLAAYRTREIQGPQLALSRTRASELLTPCGPSALPVRMSVRKAEADLKSGGHDIRKLWPPGPAIPCQWQLSEAKRPFQRLHSEDRLRRTAEQAACELLTPSGYSRCCRRRTGWSGKRALPPGS